MKRRGAAVIALAVVAALAACGREPPKRADRPQPEPWSEQPKPAPDDAPRAH